MIRKWLILRMYRHGICQNYWYTCMYMRYSHYLGCYSAHVVPNGSNMHTYMYMNVLFHVYIVYNVYYFIFPIEWKKNK